MHMTPGAHPSGSFCFCIRFRGLRLIMLNRYSLVDSGAIENRARAPYAIAFK